MSQMRIRSIKGEFWDDQKVAAWSPLARLIYIGLWSLADDCGRFPADATSVHAALARKDRPAEVEKALQEIVFSGKVLVYEHDGETFGVVLNWFHQKIDKPNHPVRPCPPDDVCAQVIDRNTNNPRFRSKDSSTLRRMFADASPNVLRLIDEDSHPPRARALDQGSGIRDQGSPLPPEGAGASEDSKPISEQYGDVWQQAADRLARVDGCGKIDRALLRSYASGMLEATGEQLERLVRQAEGIERIGNPGRWIMSSLGLIVHPPAEKKNGPSATDSSDGWVPPTRLI